MGQTTQIRNWAAWLLSGLIVLFVAGCEEVAPPLTNPLPLLASIEVVSVTPEGIHGNGHSDYPTPSADGGVVVFSSSATDLVMGDTNDQLDIFAHDRITGEITRVSVDSDGNQSNGFSFYPSISADGRFVAFQSVATNLVPGDDNSRSDIFVHDRVTGETTRASVDSDGIQSNGGCFYVSISANGRFVAFWSNATNLVTGDTNHAGDNFVHDRVTGETTRVSVDSDGNQTTTNNGRPSLSADGRFVTFSSGANNLVKGDTDDQVDIIVHDRVTGETTRVSVDSDGNQANDHSYGGTSISADGRFVAFGSLASNLVAEDNNNSWDIFAHDRLTGETTLVSVDFTGTEAAGGSEGPLISADGRFVTFNSHAPNLVNGDTNGRIDTFVHDHITGKTVRLSVNSDGVEGDDRSLYLPSPSADGRFVAFASSASNLVTGDDNGLIDAFIASNPLSTFDPTADDDGDGLTNRQELMETFTHYFLADSDGDGVDDGTELADGTDPLNPRDYPMPPPMPPPAAVEVVSVTPAGPTGNTASFGASISADGRFAAFQSDASDLVPGDTNAASDTFVHDRLTGEVTRVSVDFGGTQADGDSWSPSISADGHFVTFESDATNLVTGDTNSMRDIFVHDRTTGETTRASMNSYAKQAMWGDSFSPSISADGRFVAFHSAANNLVLWGGDTNNRDDIFVHDRLTGNTTRASVDSAGIQGDHNSRHPSLSADGRFVTFESFATNLVAGDTNSNWDVFVYDLFTGETTRVSVDSNGIQVGGISDSPVLSADGRFVAFESSATTLVAGDTNVIRDVFVHDRTTGETTRVSVDSGGTEAATYGWFGCRYPSLSADGRFVTFSSISTNLVTGDTNTMIDTFVHDRLTGETTRTSVDSAGAQANNDSISASISADGRTVMFSSKATNLAPTDANGSAFDVFIAPNPLSPFDPFADNDVDGLTNNQELLETFTHYFVADSDEDGVDDGVEVDNGTDPLDPDSF